MEQRSEHSPPLFVLIVEECFVNHSFLNPERCNYGHIWMKTVVKGFYAFTILIDS